MRQGKSLTRWTWLFPAVCLSGCQAASLGDPAETSGDGGGGGGGRAAVIDPDMTGVAGSRADDGGEGKDRPDGPSATAGSAHVGDSWDGQALGNLPPAEAGGGSGGSGSAPAGDKCPGEAITLTAGTPLTINGTLTGAADDYTTFCADTSSAAGNPDVVYQFTLASEMSVSFALSTAAFNPALSLRRKDCSSEPNGDSCINFGASSEQLRTSLAAGTYWVVVDSANGASGDFTLQITPTTPACGDGVLNTGETCDPGGAASDDGCHDPGTGNACTSGETPSNSDASTCPGFSPINPSLSNDYENRLRLGPYSNLTGGDSEENTTTADESICGWAATGPENVFHVTPQSTGTLHARIGYNASGQVWCDLNPNCADFILYMREGSCGGAQTACADFDAGNQELLEISAPVTADGNYWVFVDGYDDDWGVGKFWLEVWMTE